MSKNDEELSLAKDVARKAKELAKEREAKLLATVRAEFYSQFAEVLKAGIVEASTWHVGKGVPALTLGKASDFFLDANTGDIFFNKAGIWGQVLNIKGRDGKDGEDGRDGLRGVVGLTGEKGKDGRNGIDGKDGRNGRNGVDGAKGKDGKDGKDGTSTRWFSSRGKPNYSTGTINDFYIDSSNGNYYEKVDSMNWELRGSLRGPTGPTGFSGGGSSEGGSGEAGADGREVELQANGTHIQWRYVGEVSWTNLVTLESLKGDTGSTGATGAQGSQGIQGIQGIQGEKGEKGDTGDAGADGIDGTVITVGTTPPASPSVGTLWVDTN